MESCRRERSQEPQIYVKRCDILDRRGLLLALTSHSRAKLGRMGGFQTVEGVRTFHDHRSAKHALVSLHTWRAERHIYWWSGHKTPVLLSAGIKVERGV